MSNITPSVSEDFFRSIHLDEPEKPIHVSFAGVIGIGKSTLAEAVGKLAQCKVYKEKVEENQDLAAFYQEMEALSHKGDDEASDRFLESAFLESAFPLQISLLADRLKQHRLIKNSLKPGEMAVEDRSIYEDAIFVKCLCESSLMRSRNGEIYRNLFSEVYDMLTHPTVLVYLRAKPEVCFERIKSRGRAMEKITIEYIRQLCSDYDSFFEAMRGKLAIVVVEYDQHIDPECEKYLHVVAKLIDTIKDFVKCDDKKFETLTLTV